jgi:hypothetical protein
MEAEAIAKLLGGERPRRGEYREEPEHRDALRGLPAPVRLVPEATRRVP